MASTLETLYASYDRGASLAANDVFLVMDATGLEWGISCTDLFGNIPVAVVVEVSQTVEGAVIIDVTNTEALLVRKNADGGDVLVVDTTNNQVGVGGAPTTAFQIYHATPEVSIKSTVGSAADTTAAVPRFIGEAADGTNLWYIGSNSALDDQFAVLNQRNDVLWFGTNNVENMRLDTSGALLLGHTAQDAGGAISSLLQVHGSGNAAGLGCVAWSADTAGPVISMTKSRSAVKGTHGIITTGDVLGSIRWYGDDGVDLLPNGTASAAIQVDSIGTVGADRVPTEMSFWTATNAAPSALPKVVTIDSGGLNVAGNRPIDFDSNAGLIEMRGAASGGWINAFEFATNAGAALAQTGVYGSNPTTLVYYFIGSAYNAPWLTATASKIDARTNFTLNNPTIAGTLANGMALKNGTAGSVAMTDSVQLWAADAGGLAGHSGLHMRGEDDAANLVVVGYKEESANAETPQAAATPGTICKFTDTGDATGNGTYQLALDGTTWNQLA